jgi:hypothetical protein
MWWHISSTIYQYSAPKVHIVVRPKNQRDTDMRELRVSDVLILSISLLPGLASPALSASSSPSADFALVAATFDDGATAVGGFSKHPQSARGPLPEFYDIQIVTSAGTALPGSTFTRSGVCYDNTKKPVCAPGSNFLMYVETGESGQPGYDHLQLATYFAPNDLQGAVGVLDPTYSYEIACTLSGCFTRHIAGGAIR